jgi:HAD superfamily hydrolase (TIGR01490 family)
LYSKIRKKINNIPSSESKRYKEYLLRVFKGMSKYELEKFSKEFFKSVVQKRLHTVVIEKMMEHKKQGHIIIIASGGFENYLKYFANEYNIDYYFCTKLEFLNDRLTSKIDGNECLGLEKVNQLKQLDLNSYDLKNSYVYSDDQSDQPLFDLVGNKILVKNKQNTNWADYRYIILDVKSNA